MLEHQKLTEYRLRFVDEQTVEINDQPIKLVVGGNTDVVIFQHQGKTLIGEKLSEKPVFTDEDLAMFEAFERWQRGEFRFDSEDEDREGNSNDQNVNP